MGEQSMLKIKRMLADIIIVMLSLLAFSGLASAAPATQPPNILFIMADDHAQRAISAYGSDLIETAEYRSHRRRWRSLCEQLRHELDLRAEPRRLAHGNIQSPERVAR
jgi:hypothetical protein